MTEHGIEPAAMNAGLPACNVVPDIFWWLIVAVLCDGQRLYVKNLGPFNRCHYVSLFSCLGDLTAKGSPVCTHVMKI